MSTTRELDWAARQGWIHGLAMVLGCLASIAVLVLVIVLGLPTWVVIVAVLTCPLLLAVIGMLDRMPNKRRDGDGTTGTRKNGHTT